MTEYFGLYYGALRILSTWQQPADYSVHNGVEKTDEALKFEKQ
jgi:hypothetical protein